MREFEQFQVFKYKLSTRADREAIWAEVQHHDCYLSLGPELNNTTIVIDSRNKFNAWFALKYASQVEKVIVEDWYA
jgi:hypothetical protein